MQTMRRLQGWLPRIVGALLFTVPLIFGSATFGSGLWSAWVLGIVVGVIAIGLGLLFWLGFFTNGLIQGVTMGVGMLLFTPWVLSHNGLNVGALASSILGVFFILAAGSMLTSTWSRLAERPARQDALNATKSHGYRRASSPV